MLRGRETVLQRRNHRLELVLVHGPLPTALAQRAKDDVRYPARELRCRDGAGAPRRAAQQGLGVRSRRKRSHHHGPRTHLEVKTRAKLHQGREVAPAADAASVENLHIGPAILTSQLVSVAAHSLPVIGRGKPADIRPARVTPEYCRAQVEDRERTHGYLRRMRADDEVIADSERPADVEAQGTPQLLRPEQLVRHRRREEVQALGLELPQEPRECVGNHLERAQFLTILNFGEAWSSPHEQNRIRGRDLGHTFLLELGLGKSILEHADGRVRTRHFDIHGAGRLEVHLEPVRKHADMGEVMRLDARLFKRSEDIVRIPRRSQRAVHEACGELHTNPDLTRDSVKIGDLGKGEGLPGRDWSFLHVHYLTGEKRGNHETENGDEFVIVR